MLLHRNETASTAITGMAPPPSVEWNQTIQAKNAECLIFGSSSYSMSKTSFSATNLRLAVSPPDCRTPHPPPPVMDTREWQTANSKKSQPCLHGVH